MTVNPPHGDLVLSGIFVFASLNFHILRMEFYSKLTIEAHECGLVYMSLRELVFSFFLSGVHVIGAFCQLSPSF